MLLFFLLSGYWVTKLYYRMGGPSRVGAFYASRFLRIALLYWLCFGLAAIVLHKTINPLDLILLGVASRSSDPLGVAWSLDVELQFYLILPILLAVGSKPALASTALYASLTLIGIALVSTTGVVTAFQYLPAFAIGIVISQVNWDPGRKTAYASLAAFAVLSLAFVAVPQTRAMLDSHLPNPIDQDLFAFIWLLPLIPYVAHSLAIPSGEFDRHLGNLSYPLYLVHYPIIQLSSDALGPGFSAKGVALLSSAVVACLLYWFFDRWTDRHRRAFFEGRRLAAAS